MIRAIVEQTFDSTKKYLVMFGLSTDTKPTSGLITGSEFHEVNTGVKYEFDEVGAEWHDVGITEQEIKDEIDAWLDDHPEATTTVEDGSITNAKLASSFVSPGVASAYVPGQSYPAGSYVFNGGTLYTNDEAVDDDSWTVAHWTSVAIGNDVSNLKSAISEITVEIPTSGNFVTASNTVSGKRVYYNGNSNWIETSTTSSYSFKVFPVSKGVKYKAYGYGYDANASFYVGVLSTENFVEDGQAHTSAGAYYGYLESGTSVYPSGLTYHEIVFTSTIDGFVYINYQTDGNAATLDVSDKVFANPAPTTIVSKNGQEYTVLSKKGNMWVKRIFKNALANNLFQLYEFGYGSVDGGVYTETKTVYTATTDIVGPISIGRIIDGSSETAQWAGGNHAITVGGVACPTAEQASLKVYCGGTEITNASDGTYYGQFVAIAENDIYFPQTITDNVFTDATKAVKETRHYRVESDIDVSVELYLYTNLFIAGYYGMQLPSSFITKYFPVGEQTVYAKTDFSTATYMSHKSWLIKLQDGSDGWNYDMELSQDGLGDFGYTTSENGYAYFSQNGGKSYYQLIRLQKLTDGQGKTFYWHGRYKMYAV